MRKEFFALILFFVFQLKVNANELLAINFTQQDDLSRVEFVFNANEIQASKFNVIEDKQIVVDLKGVAAKERVLRGFDTSEFSGSIVFVSAYQKVENPEDIRVAIQLRDNVRSVLKRLPNRLVLEVENRFGAFTQNEFQRNQTFEEKKNEGLSSVGKLNVPKSEAIEDILENLTLSGRKKYIGKRISLNVKEVAIQDILSMIANASGFNIIISKEVEALPPLTLTLTNVPWDQALDTILALNKLVATKNGAILMVTTLSKATADQQAQIAAKKLAVNEEPLVTRVFPISYADIEEISKIVTDYLTAERGKVSLDVRTNSLIVKDTAEVIEKIRKIVEALDLQTPQVLIESKIVEVSETHSKSLGLQQGFIFGYDPVGNSDVNAPNDIGDATIGGTANSGPGFQFSSAPDTGDNARDFLSFAIGKYNRLFNLSFALQLLETEAKAKIVATPKVVTQNKKKAKLSTKDVTSYSVTTGTGDSATTSFETIEAKLELEVTPQVTNEGSISLQINLLKEQFGTRPSADAPPDKQERGVETNVLVDNGGTIIIGGIYNYEKRETHSGVPFLKDIPVLGWLFRTPYAPETSKNELVIFLTPRIINQEEAGLIDQS